MITDPVLRAYRSSTMLAQVITNVLSDLARRAPGDMVDIRAIRHLGAICVRDAWSSES